MEGLHITKGKLWKEHYCQLTLHDLCPFMRRKGDREERQECEDIDIVNDVINYNIYACKFTSGSQ